MKATTAEVAAMAQGYRMDRRAQAARLAFYGSPRHEALSMYISVAVSGVDDETGTPNGYTLAEAMLVVDELSEADFARLLAAE